MKALVGAFNQEKALVGAFSVIVQPVVEPMDRFAPLQKSLQSVSAAGDGILDHAMVAAGEISGMARTWDAAEYGVAGQILI